MFGLYLKQRSRVLEQFIFLVKRTPAVGKRSTSSLPVNNVQCCPKHIEDAVHHPANVLPPLKRTPHPTCSTQAEQKSLKQE